MAKHDDLVRFGVAMEGSLLRAFDALVKQRDSSRSELLRDLARAEVTRAEVGRGTDTVATITIVYDHHVRELSARLLDLQHELGGSVRSTMHVHLDAAHCLEVMIVQGPSDELRRFADRVFATRGVLHGGIDMVAAGKTPHERLHVHLHTHDHDGSHDHHTHEHGHTHEGHVHPPASKAKKKGGGR